jgi:hypothetical protein
MLTSVDVSSVRGELLTLPLQDVVDGFIIQDISGLDPVKANVVTSSFATMDGEQYESSRREKRNIVLTLGLEPDWAIGTVRQMRSRLYDFFMPKSDVALRFNSDDSDPVIISGIVESFESALFSADPTVAVSILCFNPDFYNPDPVVLSDGPYTTTTVLTDITIPYEGTVETGIYFRMEINRSLTSFTISNTSASGGDRTMDIAGAFVAGDVLEISTVPGNKYVNLTRGSGVPGSALASLSATSDWIQFYPGDNTFRVLAAGATIPYSITYYIKYGGL